MPFSLFGWLRRKTAEAVVGGVADALKAVTPDDETPPPSLEELRAIIANATASRAALTAAKDDGEDEAAPAKRKK